ncbi:lipid phosphate phosphatase 1 [Gymnopilus junonius]|uniref:Lipid phosphate phosphatase 1 n=1 Tax=Gymnopilus junonius TaxID=109634 RepID=A0A9P5TPY3_GYMJU|nr:lipid phosphate phosphatase 1 [Gymnopilus junonius]
MSRLKTFIYHYFGQGALEWFDRSYLIDWALVVLIWFLAGFAGLLPVFERTFLLSDYNINHPHKKNQVSSFVNQTIALLIPLALFFIVGCLKRSLLVVHHGALGLCTSRYEADRSGRLRPDFLARCKWDKVLEKCTGFAQIVLDGRKSFPSGHSSTAFSGMLFLSFWIAGQTAAWAFDVPKSPKRLRSSRMLAFCAALLPISWAFHVALTRIQDYRHHTEDVIVGSLLGCVCATIAYLIFWPNPFSASSFDYQVFGQPRLLYTQGEYLRTKATDFELGRLEADEEHVV